MPKYIQDNEEIDNYLYIVIQDIVDSGYELKDILTVLKDGICFPNKNPGCKINIEIGKTKEISKKRREEIVNLFEKRNFSFKNPWGVSAFNSKKINKAL